MDLNTIRHDIIGSNTFYNTPYGKRLITYADYTASGKTLYFIEDYLIKLEEVYANTHTTDSFTGKTMTLILSKAYQKIKKYVGANENNYVIPVGTGTTGAIAKLSEILGLYLTPGLKKNIDLLFDNFKGERHYNEIIIKDLFKYMSTKKPIIFVGPYEHHSNYLLWKESFAEVIEIKLTKNGFFDYDDLENQLKYYNDRIKIGSFSAASNVTGLKTDVYRIAKLMHKYDGLVFFDFAASGPYVAINMNNDEETYFDAIFLSPHKFVGGPGSSGILIINKNLYNPIYSPTVAGGGTVNYVTPYCYQFDENVEVRENAGTPGILQVIKASLALELKQKIGIDVINEIEEKYIQYAFDELKNEPNIEILGPKDPKKRISILSFNIKHDKKYLHHSFVAKLLSDLFGIQSRAGCACAGPYGYRLLNLSKKRMDLIIEMVNKGYPSIKPGFVRVNFHYLMTQDEIDFIIQAIKFIANKGYLFLTQYEMDIHTGTWKHRYTTDYHSVIDSFGIEESFKKQIRPKPINKTKFYKHYLDDANEMASFLNQSIPPKYIRFKNLKLEHLRWFNFIFLSK